MFSKYRRHCQQNTNKNDDIQMQYCEPYNIVKKTKPSNSDGVYDECRVPEQESSHYERI